VILVTENGHMPFHS